MRLDRMVSTLVGTHCESALAACCVEQAGACDGAGAGRGRAERALGGHVRRVPGAPHSQHDQEGGRDEDAEDVREQRLWESGRERRGGRQPAVEVAMGAWGMKRAVAPCAASATGRGGTDGVRESSTSRPPAGAGGARLTRAWAAVGAARRTRAGLLAMSATSCARRVPRNRASQRDDRPGGTRMRRRQAHTRAEVSVRRPVRSPRIRRTRSAAPASRAGARRPRRVADRAPPDRVPPRRSPSAGRIGPPRSQSAGQAARRPHTSAPRGAHGG